MINRIPVIYSRYPYIATPPAPVQCNKIYRLEKIKDCCAVAGILRTPLAWEPLALRTVPLRSVSETGESAVNRHPSVASETREYDEDIVIVPFAGYHDDVSSTAICAARGRLFHSVRRDGAFWQNVLGTRPGFTTTASLGTRWRTYPSRRSLIFGSQGFDTLYRDRDFVAGVTNDDDSIVCGATCLGERQRRRKRVLLRVFFFLYSLISLLYTRPNGFALEEPR